MPRKLKKSLGQHFLINKSIVRRIADAAELSNEDIVLEIGPGKGVLTEELIRRAGAVIAIEIDKNLAAFLANKFKNYSNFHLIKGDVLKLNLPEFYTKYQIPDTSSSPIFLIT